MFFKPLKLVFLSSFGLSLVLGNAAALAQSNNSTFGSVVVPTIPTGDTSTPTPINIPTTNIPTTTPNVTGDTRFSCQFHNGQYTVMYQPQSIPGQFFPWAAPAALGGGWSPEKRCQAIASRLELYRPDGLQELQIATQNNENIICVTTEANSFCRILLTVPRNKDPYVIRNSVFQNLITADSGQQTIAVNTFRHRGRTGLNDLYNLGRSLLGDDKNPPPVSRTAINLKPYLAPQDGGTLGQPKRLNPGNFR